MNPAKNPGRFAVSSFRKAIGIWTTTTERRSRPVGRAFHSPATLFHRWLANDLVNTSLPTCTGAKRSRAPFAFRRIPLRQLPATSVLCEFRFTGTNIAGSKLVRGMVK